MQFDILTIFPDLLESPLQEGIIRRAMTSGALRVCSHNIRDYAIDKHTMTDDRPFGGGEGMVMKPEPIVATLSHVKERHGAQGHVVLLSPQGRRYDQQLAEELARKEHVVLICGRYEGVDARIDSYVDDEISIGDYILTGGELAALIIVDSVCRLLPGVLGCNDSAEDDSFSRGILKHPQFTRPRDYEGMEVPQVLLSGDHQAIKEWRFVEAVKRTKDRRPELLNKTVFTSREIKLLAKHGLEVKGLSVENMEDRNRET